MKKHVVLFLLVIFVGIAIAGAIVACSKDGKYERPFGVWWWSDRLDADTYLNFAAQNGINEIYYCTDDLDDATATFINKASKKSIDVYLLAGEYTWLDDSTGLFELIEDYNSYQKQYSNAKFRGLHLDIEPHQNPDFEQNRYGLIYKLIDLAHILKDSYPDIKIDYDLPFWLHDEISFRGNTRPAYEFMIDIADRAFFMSYRDTAEAIYDVAAQEISYARQSGKIIFLSVETYSTEGDNVSFYEEGAEKMLEELKRLKKKIPRSFGLAIHHISAWKDLRDNSAHY